MAKNVKPKKAEDLTDEELREQQRRDRNQKSTPASGTQPYEGYDPRIQPGSARDEES